MTKTELEEKIKNGESVWAIYKGQSNIYEIKAVEIEKVLNDTFLWGKEYYANIKDVYKTKAEAEHYLNHANVERVETLPFLTWEEFKSGKEVIFKGNNDKGYALVYNKGLNKIDLFNTDGVFWGIVESWQPTEENFYKAYDECKKLFLG